MKRCSKCGLSVEKGIQFSKSKQTKDGLNSRCIECERKYQKQYGQSEKGKAASKKHSQSEKGRASRKRYRESEKGQIARERNRHSEKCKETQKKYYQSERCKELQTKYRLTEERRASLRKYDRSEKGKETNRKYRLSEKYKEGRRKYRLSEKGQKALRKYQQSEKGRAAQKKGRETEATKKRKKESYAKNSVSVCISSMMRYSLKGNKKGRHWEDVVDWTLEQFKRRFARLFKPGMTWENHGKVWEIDHIQPVSAHNITSIDCTDFKRAWTLSNLQPLFKEENRSKSNKLEKHFQPTLF